VIISKLKWKKIRARGCQIWNKIIDRGPRHQYFNAYRPPPKVEKKSAAYIGTLTLLSYSHEYIDFALSAKFGLRKIDRRQMIINKVIDEINLDSRKVKRMAKLKSPFLDQLKSLDQTPKPRYWIIYLKLQVIPVYLLMY